MSKITDLSKFKAMKEGGLDQLAYEVAQPFFDKIDAEAVSLDKQLEDLYRKNTFSLNLSAEEDERFRGQLVALRNAYFAIISDLFMKLTKAEQKVFYLQNKIEWSDGDGKK